MKPSPPSPDSNTKSRRLRHDPNIWRPQKQFSTRLKSSSDANLFNSIGGIAVYLDFLRNQKPDIMITGSQSESFSFWKTHSKSGFVTKPKFSERLLTFRFVTSGYIIYLHRSGEMLASDAIAVLADFDSIYEVRAPDSVSAVSATLSAETLVDAHRALTGDKHSSLPRLEQIADMTMPGMTALFSTVRLLQRRIGDFDKHSDLLLPLFQELISYQILSSWPRFTEKPPAQYKAFGSRQLGIAVDYIEANLLYPMTLADVAAAAGTSVRSLQIKFKSQLGQTPIGFIIERRLARVHEDLISSEKRELSISDIARTWGFVYMSDFGKRYRLRYGCTPSETRRATS